MQKFHLLFLLVLLLSACKIGKNVQKEYYNPAYTNAFHEAVRLKIQGQTDAAISAFEKCLLIRQDDDAPYYALSELYLQKENKAKSEENILKAYEIDQSNIWYSQELAYMYFDQKKYPEAIKFFQKLVDHEPRNIEWLYGYAESLLRGGKAADAIKAFDRMEDQLGKVPELSLQKFRIYMYLKQEEKAIAEIESCRKIFPEDPQLLAALVDFYFQKGQLDKAIGLLEGLVKADPSNGNAFLALADIYRQKGEMSKAYVALKMAFACESVTIDDKMQILLSIFGSNEKTAPEVMDLVYLLVQQHPQESKAHSILGDFLLKDGNEKGALAAYKEALSLDGNLYPIWNQVLVMEYQHNMFPELYADSKRCLEYFTTQPLVYLMNGLSAVKLKKFDEAIVSLQSGIELISNDKPMESEFNAQLGEAHFGMKKFDQGIEFYENALKLDPASYLIRNNYAYRLAFWKKNLDRALKLIDEVVAVSPSAHYLDTKGYVHFQRGEYEEARVALAKAADLDAKDHFIFDHLGDAFFMLGDKVLAVESWKKAKELGSTNKVIDQKIEKKTYYDPIY